MGILVSAVLLYVLVSVFNEGVDDSIRWKILALAVLISLLELLVQQTPLPALPQFGAILGCAIVVGLLLMGWCKLSRAVSGKVAGTFLAIRLVIGIVPLLIGSNGA